MAREKNVTDVPVRMPSQSALSRSGGTAEQVSDAVLASRVAQGDTAALEALYDRYASTVLGIALRVIGDREAAEDVLQETFWRLWKSAATFQAARGSFAGWLFRITRNLAIDSYRRRNVRPQTVPETAASEPVLDQMPDRAMDVAEQTQVMLKNRQVHKALTSLPDSQRQVIELAYFHGMTRQEIAAATGEALGTIHTRARLALQKLREELDREDFEG